MPSEKTLVPAASGDDLLALVELALEEARVLGATQAEAAVSVERPLHGGRRGELLQASRGVAAAAAVGA